MAFKDNRTYIAALEKKKLLKRIKEEVHWNLEAGAIMRLVNEKGLPSPLFQKITGYPPEYTIFGSPLSSWKKLAVAFGLKAETDQQGLIDVYRQRKNNLIKPIQVDKKNAPCKENIHLAKDVNLFQFPAPMLHDGDGGRYMCTWHINISRDPDTGWVNWGMYRAMINSKTTLAGLVEPNQHIGYHFHRKYLPRGLGMPFAIAIGPDPLSAFVGCSKIPQGINEADVAGALLQEPVELVKCETNDTLVPAHAEIIIEGEISPTEKEWEGPFGEFTGYRASPRDKRSIYKVKAITHRNNPILTASCMGMPVDESDITTSVARSGDILDELKRAGITVVQVNVPPECVCMLAIVSVNVKAAKVPYLADRVAACIWGSEFGANLPPYVIVVDDDVDVFDLPMVMHALSTKCHPWRGINKVEHSVGYLLTPFLTRHERMNRFGAKASFDCTWPTDWDPSIAVPPKASFKGIYPRDVQEHVLKKWEKYGFDKLDGR